MFPLGLLLLLMAGNAPAPAVRLSRAPLPALILQALNKPPLPHHRETPTHLETVGKEYSPDPFFLLGKEKNPMNLTIFLLNHFSLKHMIPRKNIPKEEYSEVLVFQ